MSAGCAPAAMWPGKGDEMAFLAPYALLLSHSCERRPDASAGAFTLTRAYQIPTLPTGDTPRSWTLEACGYKLSFNLHAVEGKGLHIAADEWPTPEMSSRFRFGRELDAARSAMPTCPRALHEGCLATQAGLFQCRQSIRRVERKEASDVGGGSYEVTACSKRRRVEIVCPSSSADCVPRVVQEDEAPAPR